MASSANIWEGPGGTIPVVNADGNVFEEVQVATAAQTLFTLLTFQYTPGTKSIFVFRKSGGIGGQMLRRNVDYLETSATQITLAVGATAGDLLFFVSVAISEIDSPPILNGLPPGGTTGQVLQKISGSDYAVNWVSLTALASLLDSPRQNVASASTINLLTFATTTRNIQITGSVQIDGFQISNGQLFAVRFQNSVLLKNNANIVTQAGQDIRVTPGSTCFIRATADNVVEILVYSAAAASEPNQNYCEFRLTLQIGTPVTSTDILAGNVIYCSPYLGNKISLYDGISWNTRQSAEFSLALAGLTVNRPYDVFCYDNAGVPTLEFLSWASLTARATALAVQDGVYVKSGDSTRRYLGSFFALSATTTADSETNRILFNYYNRVSRSLNVQETAGTWNYTTAVYRQANANVANRVYVMVGVAEDLVEMNLESSASNTNVGVDMFAAIGLNSTTVNAAGSKVGITTQPGANYNSGMKAYYNKIPAIGLQQFFWLEQSTAVGTTTWYGLTRSGLTGSCKA